jgi:hypothetical protein
MIQRGADKRNQSAINDNMLPTGVAAEDFCAINKKLRNRNKANTILTN